MAMQKKSLFILSTALSVLAVTAPYAQAQSMDKLEARFNAADTNHDGKLTLAEAQAGMPRVAKNFDRIDTDHTGAITVDQIAAFAKAQKGG